jgi:hypothetical protein
MTILRCDACQRDKSPLEGDEWTRLEIGGGRVFQEVPGGPVQRTMAVAYDFCPSCAKSIERAAQRVREAHVKLRTLGHSECLARGTIR